MDIDERIKQHYLLEKKLAQRIMNSSPQERTRVAMEAYNQLYSSIPWHPSLRLSEEQERKCLARKRMFFEHLVNPGVDILDIGTGTAYWIRSLAAKNAGHCVGIDISKEVLTKRPDDPLNLELQIMDAVELNFAAESFDIALSSQLIEHLHPDDVENHLSKVYRVLKKGGAYAFDTPHQLTGPHDVSEYFDQIATGFHLKEWTYQELAIRLKRVGFKKIYTMVLPWNLVNRFSLFRPLGTVPISWVIPGEMLAAKIKHKQRRNLLCKLFRVASIYIIARK